MGETHTGTSRIRGHYCWESSSLLLRRTGQRCRSILWYTNQYQIPSPYREHGKNCNICPVFLFFPAQKRQFITFKNLIGRFPILMTLERSRKLVPRSLETFGKFVRTCSSSASAIFLWRPWPRRLGIMRSKRRTNVFPSSTMQLAHRPIRLLPANNSIMAIVSFLSHSWNTTGITVVTVKNSP